MISKDSTNLISMRRINRRTFLKMAGAGAGAVALGGTMRYAFGLVPPETGCGIQEFQPYVSSPFIEKPFIDPLPQPTAYKPGWRRPDGTLDPLAADAWRVRRAAFPGAVPIPGSTDVIVVPGPAESQQDVYGHLPAGVRVVNGVGDVQTTAVEHAGTHQVWPNAAGQNSDRLVGLAHGPFPDPILYHIRYQVSTHSFSNSPVRVLRDFRDPNGNLIRAGTVVPKLPDSTIYGFNGTFPGPMINQEYGKPILIRFENDLDINPKAGSPPGTPPLDRQDFGAPDWAVLTHQHNGHNAPESDGQPHYMQINDGGYTPGDWYDNLYLMYPAGGDPSEIQSFLWFHDHRMHFTGANVFKGQVGLTPQYDPGIPVTDANGNPVLDANGNPVIVPGTGLDPGDETKGLRLPGVRVDHGDGTFDVKYDIPMALYDTSLDDGVTPHADLHVDLAACGAAHPEWWGKTFFRHWPNHGFVGDIFTVNCTAYPVLNVFQRRYRFRFLGASVSRIYELALMTSAAGPVERPGTQGQWQIPDGVMWKQWTWIASMGGLLPKASLSDTNFVWPASRREFVVDFTGVPAGTVIYITNILEMPDGRKPNFDPGTPVNNRAYKVPLVKIIVGGAPPEPQGDQSLPIAEGTPLRPMPKLDNGAGAAVTLASTAALPHKVFRLSRGGPTTESQWVINDLPFDALVPLTTVVRGQPEVWTNENGGGGWVHPMHMHMEENTVLARVGSTLPIHPEDAGKEDLTNLEPSESVTFYRNFRTFTGRYVAHCHNLAHEDHNMMFGFSILAPPAAGTFALSGTVTDGAGAGMAGVLMTLTNAAGVVATTPTDGAGNYSIAGLADGVYTITPTKAGFAFTPLSAGVTIAGANVTVPNFVGTPVAGAAIFAISGQVTNKVGRPLGNVLMTLSGAANATINTDAFGHYDFRGLADGRYTITPSLAGVRFVPRRRNVTVRGANLIDRNFRGIS